jgi:hypothetical protein
MKNSIAKKIAWLLPPRVLLWAVIRGFSNATTGEHSNRVATEVGYEEVYDSIVKKYEIKL